MTQRTPIEVYVPVATAFFNSDITAKEATRPGLPVCPNAYHYPYPRTANAWYSNNNSLLQCAMVLEGWKTCRCHHQHTQVCEFHVKGTVWEAWFHKCRLPAVTAGVREVVQEEGVLCTVFPEGIASGWVRGISRQRGNGDRERKGLRGRVSVHSSKVWHPLPTELRGKQVLVAVKETVDASFAQCVHNALQHLQS